MLEHPRLEKNSRWSHLQGLTGATFKVRRNQAGEGGGSSKASDVCRLSYPHPHPRRPSTNACKVLDPVPG